MDYQEASPPALAHFFEWWDYYKTINGMHDRPASERFQAFKAAWTMYEPESESIVPYDEVKGYDAMTAPPEYDMLRDWLASERSGFWEPVSG